MPAIKELWEVSTGIYQGWLVEGEGFYLRITEGEPDKFFKNVHLEVGDSAHEVRAVITSDVDSTVKLPTTDEELAILFDKYSNISCSLPINKIGREEFYEILTYIKKELGIDVDDDSFQEIVSS